MAGLNGKKWLLYALTGRCLGQTFATATACDWSALIDIAVGREGTRGVQRLARSNYCSISAHQLSPREESGEVMQHLKQSLSRVA